MQDRTRLADLATRAGVSIATVSRVLNGRPGVAAATRSQVLGALDEVGYTSTDTTAGRLVGLITPTLGTPGAAGSLVEAVQGRLGAADYSPLLAAHTDGGVAWAIDTLLRRKVIGMIVVGPARLSAGDAAALDRVLAQQLPLVLLEIPRAQLERYGSKPAGVGVRTDHRRGIELALDHLQSLGHRRIGLLADDAAGPASDAFIARCGPDRIAVTPSTVAAAESTASGLLDRCSAIVATSDLLAIGALRAAGAADRAVPAEVSVVALADSPLTAYAMPSVTSVRAPVTELGRTATDALLGALAPPIEPRRIAGELTLPPELVVRQSSGPASRSATD